MRIVGMSQLGCPCGHTISDTTDSLPYKGYVLSDVRYFPFLQWLVDETQSYVEAAQAGRVAQWFLQRGYGQDYLDLKLSHGEMLHDYIHAKLDRLMREMYECKACGRIHMETREDNHFARYAPDSEKVNGIFAGPDQD